MERNDSDVADHCGGPWSPPRPREYAARVVAIEIQMSQRGLAALVVAGPQNIYYLSGLDFLS